MDSIGFAEYLSKKWNMPKKEDVVSEIIEKAAPVPDNSAQDYSDVPVYYEPFSYAKENDEVDLYRTSYRLNSECKQAIHEAIADNYDGMYLTTNEGSKGLYRSLGSIDVVAAARSVLQVERDTENPDIRIVHQIKNSLAPTAEDIRFSISADKGFRWLECRPQLFEKQQPDAEPKFDTEQQKAAYWIKHFLEKGDMSANEIYCRLDNEGVSKRVARMVKTEMGIHCYQKKRRWYWSVQLEEGAMNGAQV